jgi:hypothetical protein
MAGPESAVEWRAGEGQPLSDRWSSCYGRSRRCRATACAGGCVGRCDRRAQGRRASRWHAPTGAAPANCRGQLRLRVVCLPKLVGVGALEGAGVVGMRPGRRLFRLIAGLTQGTGHSLGAGRQGQTAREHSADAFAASVELASLSMKMAHRVTRATGSRLPSRGADRAARLGPPNRTCASRRAGYAWTMVCTPASRRRSC